MNYMPHGQMELASGPVYTEYAAADQTSVESPIDI